jgi:hypothetical protein
VLEEIRRLPPAVLREVCEAINQLAAQASAPPATLETPPPSCRPTEEDEDEAAFFAALAEARRLWNQPGRELPDFE